MNDNELEDLNNKFNEYFEEKERLKSRNDLKNIERSVKLNFSNNLFEKNESSTILDDINENDLCNIAYYQHRYTLKLDKLDNENYLEKLIEKYNRLIHSDEEDVGEEGDVDDDIIHNLSQNDIDDEDENLEGLSVKVSII